MSPAFSIVNLFVCKNSHASWTPIYCRIFLVSKPLLIHFKKNPLVPFVIIWLVSFNNSVPIICQTKSFLLHNKICNCFLCKDFWMGFCFYCGILSRQSKRIKSHRMKNIKSLHKFQSCINVSYYIIKSMANMKPASRRIRIHFNNIKLFFIRIFRNIENFFLAPFLLPFFFYFREIKFCHKKSRDNKLLNIALFFRIYGKDKSLSNWRNDF
ncbi:Uncharacterised protein [uncultured archaeon]|nr:Uncharacterised protein [uncultured archaeon]